MSSIFLFLCLLCILGLIIGLIKPSLFKQSRKQISKLFGIGIVAFFVMFGILSPSTPSSTQPASRQDQPVAAQNQPAAQSSFAQLAQKRFADIKTSIPELQDIHCLDETCIAVVYFDFNTIPDDLETIVRGNAATFSKFEMDNSVGSHVTVFAQHNGNTVFQCDAADAKVTSCK